jgi:glutaredoxin 3
VSCNFAKEFLSHHKVRFTSRNVTEDPEALRELMEKTGRRATPVIVVDGNVVIGFDRGKLERLLGL